MHLALALVLLAPKPGRPHSRVYYQKVPLFRAGRNQACPCGSSSKFKNCCIHAFKYLTIQGPTHGM